MKRTLEVGAGIGEALLLRQELRNLLTGDHGSRAMPSICNFAARWIEVAATRNRRRVPEVQLQVLRDHVLPEIGHLGVDEVTRNDIIKLTDTWSKKRLSDGSLYSRETVANWWKITRALFADAGAEFGLSTPTERVRLPRMSDRHLRREQRTLTPVEIVALLDFAEKYRTARYAEVAMFALGAFRPSELYALHLCDVDLITGAVAIRRSVDRGYLDAPKVERSDRGYVAGQRIQVVPVRARDAVRVHLERRAEHSPDAILFPSTAGTHRSPASMDKFYRAAECALRLRLRLGNQVLRRSYNTIVKDLTDQATLHAMIGHSDPRMTELYSHVDLAKKQEAAARLTALLGESAG